MAAINVGVLILIKCGEDSATSDPSSRSKATLICKSNKLFLMKTSKIEVQAGCS